MTKEVKPDPIENEIINFSFTVAQTNRLLEILGEAPLPYVLTAPLIALIKMQGEPQFEELKKKVKHEPKTTS